MVKVEARVVIKAPRNEVYAWFTKPGNWAKYEGAAWKSIKVIEKEGQAVTAAQEGTIAGKSAKGTFKYTFSPAEKIESVWSKGTYGSTKIRGQCFSWNFVEVPGGTKVSWSIEAEIPCIVKLFGPSGETKLQGLMQKELEKIQKMLQK
jgi:carbon monoxide dehydrogenase subunit G